MKKMTAPILLLLFVALFAGCVSSGGRFLAVGCVSTQNDTSFSMTYSSLDGKKFYVIHPKKDTTLNVRFETVSGALSCCVIEKSTGAVLFDRREIRTSEDAVGLKKGESYTIWIEAKEHEGAFFFDWSGHEEKER